MNLLGLVKKNLHKANANDGSLQRLCIVAGNINFSIVSKLFLFPHILVLTEAGL